jgi:UDP-glucose 4-epimerase
LVPGADVEIGEALSEGEKAVAAYRGQLEVESARKLGWHPRFASLRDGIVDYAKAYRSFLATE